MAEPNSPPPSYASLYQGGSSAPPQGQPLPAAYPDGTPQAAHSGPSSQQGYTEYPPTKGYPPGEPTYPSAPPTQPGAYPQNYGSNAYPPQDSYPGGYPMAPMGGYPQAPGAAADHAHAPMMDMYQATQLDPQGVQVQFATENQPEIPVNPRAPAECVLGSLADHHVQIAPGQEPGLDDDGPSKTNLCWGVWSIIAHVCFVVCIILLAVQIPLKQKYDAWWPTVGKDERTSKSDQFGYNQTTLICASVFLVVCYLVALIEGCASGTSDYVQYADRFVDFRSYNAIVRKSVPTVELKAEAFHLGKERIEWSNGAMVSRRNSETMQKCVTHQERMAFPFSKCLDASETLDTFKQGKLYRVAYGKTFGFLDAATESEFTRQKEDLIARVNDKDTDHSIEQTLILPNLKERTTVYIDEAQGNPSYISFNLYSCLACIMCTWPYRIFFRLATRKKKFTFVKLIGI